MSRPTLLTPQQVADHLGVSRKTVYKMIADGTLAHQRVRSMIRIPEDSLPVTVKAIPMEVPYPKTRPITGEFARMAHVPVDRQGDAA
jgi:excisionase family DNA binding protein